MRCFALIKKQNKMKLISITEHSDYLHNMNLTSMSERWESHRKRVEFGKQKLELWMFVPCKLVEGVWVVLEEPINYSAFEVGMSQKDFNYCFPDCQEFQKAKDGVLFEGFECKNERNFYDWRMDNELGSVENLVGLEFTLTQTAKKQIGL